MGNNCTSCFMAGNWVARCMNRWKICVNRRKRRKTIIYISPSHSPSVSSFGDRQSIMSACPSLLAEESLEESSENVHVLLVESPTDEDQAEREVRTNWLQTYKLFFWQKNFKMVIDGSYPLSGNIFEILKSCPLDELDVEFRFMNLGLFDGESWHVFCSKLRHLKLYQCYLNCSAILGIVTSGKNLISLRIVMPNMRKCDLHAVYTSTQLSVNRSPFLKTLTYCDSDPEIFESFLAFLLFIYPNIVNFKIYLKIFSFTPPTADCDGQMITDIHVCKVILDQLEMKSKEIRSLDLKITDGSPSGGCQIIPITTMLHLSELISLTKISFHLHEHPGNEFIEMLPNLVHLRAIKLSINFIETGSSTYNFCLITLSNLVKLRSLKIVYCQLFILDNDMLELLVNSQLRKLLITAESVCVTADGESLRLKNESLQDLKLRVDHFSPLQKRGDEIDRFMKIFLRVFQKLRLLHCAPVRNIIMEEIIRCQKKLEELNVELHHCSNDLFARLPTRSKEKHVHSIGDFGNLRHLSLTDFNANLEIGIFSFITSEKIKSCKLFGCQKEVPRLDEQVGKYFRKFRQLSLFQYNSYLYVLDPFLQTPSKMIYIDLQNLISDEYAEGNLKVIGSIKDDSGKKQKTWKSIFHFQP